MLTESRHYPHQVMPDDFLHYHGEWDAQIKDAFKYFNQVAQPLGELIETTYQNKVKLIAAGLAEPDSILNCYYQPVNIALAV